MKKILLTADYQVTGVKEFDGKWLSPENFELPDGLWNEVKNWVESYQFIIPLDMPDRLKLKDKIIHLDKEGLEIARKVASLKKDCTILYYSEGLLKYIDIEQTSETKPPNFN